MCARGSRGGGDILIGGVLCRGVEVPDLVVGSGVNFEWENKKLMDFLKS
jgi:hypothetical protein